MARFRTEAEAAASLDHPHIVPIHEVGSHEGQSYLTMKFVEGGSLAQHAGRFRGDPKGAAFLVAAVARAVHHAHQRGILHRDLKPSNILLQMGNGQWGMGNKNPQDTPFPIAHSPLPTPLVTDFGLAKRTAGPESPDGVLPGPTVPLPAPLTHTGAVVGTPGYMAPEQATGSRGAVTTAADVYGLGAVLYELLTGQAPFRAGTVFETLRQVREQAPTRPRALNPVLDRDLETICLKCLEKEPGRRYASAQELADDLDRYRRGEPIQARPAGPLGRAWRWARRQPLVAGLAAALMLALIGILGLVTVQWMRAEEHARELERERDRAREAGERATANALAFQEQRNRAREAEGRAEGSRRQAQRAIELFCRKASDHMRQSPELQPVCEAMLKEARDYYLAFLRDNGDDPTLRRDLADTHRRLGEVIGAIGTRAEARAAYGKARDLYRELHRLEPDDREVQGQLADAVSNLALLQDTHEAALAGCQEALQLYLDFLRPHPEDLELRKGLAVAMSNRASFHEKRGDRGEAVRWLRSAREHLEEMLHSRPADADLRARLADTLHHYAVACGRQTDSKSREESLQAYGDAYRLRKNLAEEEPLNGGRKADLAASLVSLGIAQRDAGQPKEALASFQEALTIRQRLVDVNPRTTRYRLDLASAWTHLGVLHGRQGRPDEAQRCYEKARDLQDRLHRFDPGEPAFRRDLAQSWYNLGVLYAEQNKRTEEDAALAQARTLQQVLAKEDPKNPEYHADLSRTLHRIGCNRLATGRLADASDVLRQAVGEARFVLERTQQGETYRQGIDACYETLAEAECRMGRPRLAVQTLLERQRWWSRNPDQLYRTAAGLAGIAEKIGDQGERRRCLAQALQSLREAVNFGFRDVTMLKEDPRLQLLRKDERFQALLEKANAGR